MSYVSDLVIVLGRQDITTRRESTNFSPFLLNVTPNYTAVSEVESLCFVEL